MFEEDHVVFFENDTDTDLSLRNSDGNTIIDTADRYNVWENSSRMNLITQSS